MKGAFVPRWTVHRCREQNSSSRLALCSLWYRFVTEKAGTRNVLNEFFIIKKESG